MENPRGRFSFLAEAIDSTDRLALLVEYPEFLDKNDVVRGHEIKSGSPEG